jgi:cytochrome c oxidase assembly protein subunit 11
MEKNKKILTPLILIIIGMFVLAYASVPLYSLFCKATGFGGTTQVALKSSTQKGKKVIKVRFDANIEPNLPWKFKPIQPEITVKPGENALIFYYAENLTEKPLTGTAIYNVTPNKAGIYFNKIECFCFEEQLLEPYQKVNMPVSFFIDPKIEEDPYLKDVDTITLSYSFFYVKKDSKFNR